MMRLAMSMVAPKERKYLCADALFRLVRSGFANIADDRYGDAEISLTDTLMSAFAMFSLKSPSLLAFDKERAEGNLDRKSTRLNSSHSQISYAVFCLKKKKKYNDQTTEHHVKNPEANKAKLEPSVYNGDEQDGVPWHFMYVS